MKKYLLLALALSAGAFAAPKESPAQIVQKLYDAYQQPSVQENTALFEDYVNAELKALLAKDEQLAGDEIGCLDYDFVIQGQDYDAESIKKTLKIKALDKESVEAKFQNFDTPATVIYKFACDDKQCQITDLLEEDQETHKPKSFKEGLANCLADLEKSASAK